MTLRFVFPVILAAVCMAQQPPSPEKPFFDISVYTARGAVEGTALGPEYTGRSLPRTEVAEEVLKKLLLLAGSLGIAEKDVTQAIFEGKLNPAYEDIRILNDVGVNWSARFGAIIDLPRLRTIFNGKEEQLNGKDLIFRAVIRRGMPVPVDPTLTYDKAVASGMFGGQLLDWMMAEESSRTNRPARYFMINGNEKTGSGRADYEAIRTRLFLPLWKRGGRMTLTKATPAPATPKTLAATAAKTLSCDDLAAHPEDKNKVGRGVEDDDIIPAPAIEQCAAEIGSHPNDARLHFQLGRAYWAAEDYDEALDAFLKAEELGYAPAYFYIGMAYEDGLIEGEKADPAAAREMYLIAASEGFEPAARFYQETAPRDEKDGILFSDFKQPKLMRALYEGDVKALPANTTTLAYVRGMYNIVEDQPPNDYDRTCEGKADPKAAQVLASRVNNEIVQIFYPLIIQALREEARMIGEIARTGRSSKKKVTVDPDAKRVAVILEAYADAGEADFYQLVYDYGTCNGEPAKKVLATITQFMTGGVK